MKQWFWVLDATVVVTFVVIGRDSHGFATDWTATARVALPFLIALAVGIGLTRAWMRPTNWLVGLGIAAVTVVGGLALRKYVFNAGTATTFVWLTAGWMTAWMVGWRLAVTFVARITQRRGASTAA
ncbi:MAG: DUF3054 domain-containing protein [Actinomycetota bacterium]